MHVQLPPCWPPSQWAPCFTNPQVTDPEQITTGRIKLVFTENQATGTRMGPLQVGSGGSGGTVGQLPEGKKVRAGGGLVGNGSSWGLCVRDADRAATGTKPPRGMR